MTQQGTRIYLTGLEAGYSLALRQALVSMNLSSRLKSGDRVYIKPNLTFPHFRPGVMTNPECLESLVAALGDYTRNVTIVEADSGGYNRFPMDEVFERTGLNAMAKRYGVQVVNLSRLPSRNITFMHGRREISIPLPAVLLDEADMLITVPVPKVHSNTGVSLAIKNQWGCIPDPAARLRLHPFFAKAVHEINIALRTAIAIVDGRYGLDGNGPMLGDVVNLNWLLVSDNIYAADLACCRLMQIEPSSVPYLRYLDRVGVLPSESSLVFSEDHRPFLTRKFRLRRAWTDYPGWLAFRSSWVAHLAYHSRLSDALHRILYLFREPFYDYAGERARLNTPEQEPADTPQRGSTPP